MLSSLKSDEPRYIDLSIELADELDWKAGTLRNFEHHLDITAWAYEAVSGLLAIGPCLSIFASLSLIACRDGRWIHRHLRWSWSRAPNRAR